MKCSSGHCNTMQQQSGICHGKSTQNHAPLMVPFDTENKTEGSITSGALQTHMSEIISSGKTIHILKYFAAQYHCKYRSATRVL